MSNKTVKTEEAAAATAKAKTTAAAAEGVAYLGPDLKNVAINGTVYTGRPAGCLEEKDRGGTGA